MPQEMGAVNYAGVRNWKYRGKYSPVPLVQQTLFRGDASGNICTRASPVVTNKRYELLKGSLKCN